MYGALIAFGVTNLSDGLPIYVINDLLGAFFGCALGGVEADFGMERRLVGVVDAGEAFEFAAAGFGVEAFHITAFALFERGIDEDLDELIGADAIDHLAHGVAGVAEGADDGANHDSVVPDDFGSDKANPKDIGIAIFAAKA